MDVTQFVEQHRTDWERLDQLAAPVGLWAA